MAQELIKVLLGSGIEKDQTLEKMVLEARKKTDLEERIRALEKQTNTLQEMVGALKLAFIADLEEKSSALEDEMAKLKKKKMVLEREEEAAGTPTEAPVSAEEPVPA
jgi:peptidoglycan hydrolase CwlO-like protein